MPVVSKKTKKTLKKKSASILKMEQERDFLISKKRIDALFSGLPEKSKKMNPRTSPHLLDLRDVAMRQEIRKSMEKAPKGLDQISAFPQKIERAHEKIQKMSAKVFSSLPSKKQAGRLVTQYTMPSETLVGTLNNQADFRPSAKKERPTAPAKAPIAFKLPKLSLPELKLPDFSWIRLPKIKFPVFQIPKFNFGFDLSSLKPALAFGAIAMLIASPLLAYDYKHDLENTRGKVLGITASAIDHVKLSAATSTADDFISAQYELTTARDLFAQAKKELDQIPGTIQAGLSAIPEGKQLTAAKNLLEIASVLSDVSSQVIGAFDSESSIETLTGKITFIQQTLLANKTRLEAAGQLALQVDENSLPEEYRARLSTILTAVPLLTQNIEAISGHIDLLQELLGNNQSRRYLILFQNSNELRPTGGFLGSYAELNIFQGEIKNINIPSGGFYDLEGGLKVNVEPPHPLSALNERWEIQDSNYFPDFSTSAQKLLWFYQKSGGPSVDGVISINPAVIQKVLEATGPIQTADGEINSTNVLDELQYATELGPDKGTEHPKRLIAELAPKLFDYMTSPDSASIGAKMRLLDESLRTQDIQLYFENPELQVAADSYHWTGKLIETKGDYLNIVSTNVAGGKTNKFLHDDVEVNVQLNDDGSSTNTITLTRTHNGPLNHPLYGVKNNDYLRFYLPLGATFISAQGFEQLPEAAFRTAGYATEKDSDIGLSQNTAIKDQSSGTDIFQEGNRTVMANWMQVSVGETKSVSLTYKVPGKEVVSEKSDWLSFLKKELVPNSEYRPYSLVVQKQSGKENQVYSITVKGPSNTGIAWAYPAASRIDGEQLSVSQYPLNHSLFIGALFQTQE